MSPNARAPGTPQDSDSIHLNKHLGYFLAALASFFVLFMGCADKSVPASGDAEQGSSQYVEYCQSCHGDARTGEGGTPDAPTHGPEGHTWHHADGQLVDIILGRLQYPGRVMPSFGDILSDQQALNILAYLKTNWSVEQLSFQAEVSRNWEEISKP